MDILFTESLLKSLARRCLIATPVNFPFFSMYSPHSWAGSFLGQTEPYNNTNGWGSSSSSDWKPTRSCFPPPQGFSDPAGLSDSLIGCPEAGRIAGQLAGLAGWQVGWQLAYAGQQSSWLLVLVFGFGRGYLQERPYSWVAICFFSKLWCDIPNSFLISQFHFYFHFIHYSSNRYPIPCELALWKVGLLFSARRGVYSGVIPRHRIHSVSAATRQRSQLVVTLLPLKTLSI